ncbi:MAG TPA: hypothetical protein VI142_07425 [Gaiellaceae bacterium]
MTLLFAIMLALVAFVAFGSYLAFGGDGIIYGLGFGALVGGLLLLLWWLRPRSR